MESNDTILKIISNDTKDSVLQMPIVTPSIYASIFSEYATKHDANIDDEIELSKDLLKNECSTLTQLQESASKNATKLSDSASKAISAIKEKDETLLNEVLKETEALRAEVEKLKESVYKDELTHAYNRKWLHDTYLQSNSNHFKCAGTLVIVDLNYFKQVNDTHGHVIGDKVLIFIANQLKKSKHHVVRYGGDEFLIIFSQRTNINEAKKILSDIRENVLDKKLKAHNTTFRVSFSLGGVEFKENDELESIIEKADKEMYHDKVEIKNRIQGI
jgi:diguanylate cyclase (GGDEF)-like protein